MEEIGKSVGIAIFHENGLIEWKNDAFQKIFPESVQENSNILELIPENYHGVFLGKIKQLPQSEGKQAFIEIPKTATTTFMKWVISLNETSLEENSPSFDCTVESFHSVKNYIPENSSLFKELVENSGDVIYRANFDGILTYINPTGVDFLGFEKEDILGIHFSQLVKEEYREEVKEFYFDQFSNKIGRTYYELPIKTNRKKTIWIGQTVEMLADGDWIIGFQCVARNITDKVLALRKLEERELELKALFEAIPSCVVRIDKRGTVLQHKHGLSPIVPLSESPVGSRLHDIFPETTVTDEVLKISKLTLKDGETRILPFDFYKDDGIKHYFEAHIAKSNDKEVVITIDDITRHKLVELEVKKAQIEASSTLKSKEEFISVLSHEIRNPLNAIKGLSEQLSTKATEGKTKELADGIGYSVNNVLGIINNILDLSKINSENIVLENIKIDLRKLATDVLNTAALSIQNEGIKTNVEVDEAIPSSVFGDPLRLQQILNNLISNAFKFTEEGEISIQISLIEQDQDTLNIKFEVSDSGIGIPEEKIADIFEPYKQASQDTSRKFGGTGLGLSIVKKLIELNGGKIDIKSVPNQGSTFFFNIVFNKEDSEESINRKETNIKILIAEDNELNQVVISNYLNHPQISLDIADTGNLALKRVTNNFYDLILLDLQLPGVSGEEIAMTLKQLRDQTPIICISGNEIDDVKLKEYGIADLIKKPIAKDTLLQKVSKHTNTAFFKTVKPQEYSQNNGQLIDLSYLIESSLNDTKYIRNMINIFLEKAPEYIEDINRSYKDQDLAELKRIAHKFKASINIMGIKSVSKLLNILELNIEQNNSIESLSNLISGIELYTNTASKELEEYLSAKN